MLVCCERYVWKISQNYTFLFATWWQNPEWARISKLFECFGQRWYTTAGRSCRLTRSFQSYEVCKKLFSIKPSKAHGPDNIPCRVLNEFAYELAAPIATIFNVSLTNGIVPVYHIKALEDFVVSWMIGDVRENIEPNQFGCLKGTSTTYCLLDMVHTWLSHVEPPW